MCLVSYRLLNTGFASTKTQPRWKTIINRLTSEHCINRRYNARTIDKKRTISSCVVSTIVCKPYLKETTFIAFFSCHNSLLVCLYTIHLSAVAI